MKFLLQLAFFIGFALLVLAGDPKELVIDTTYLPENCGQKAAKGDSIEVHYVREHFQGRGTIALWIFIFVDWEAVC